MREGLPEIAVSIVTHDKHALLVERANPENGASGAVLSWVFPGGKIEDGESPEQAAQRETLKETGYEVCANSRIAEGQHDSFPAYVYYVACQLKHGLNRKTMNDKAIRTAKFVPINKVRRRITSPINPHVAKCLEIE